VIQGFRSGNAYRLGDTVQVAVASVDVDRRELDFRLLGKTGQAARKPAKKSRTSKPAKSKGKGRRKRH